MKRGATVRVLRSQVSGLRSYAVGIKLDEDVQISSVNVSLNSCFSLSLSLFFLSRALSISSLSLSLTCTVNGRPIMYIGPPSSASGFTAKASVLVTASGWGEKRAEAGARRARVRGGGVFERPCENNGSY